MTDATIPPDADAQSYLRSQAITDEATWAAFRLGKVNEAVLALFGASKPKGVGVIIPTFDPRNPDTVVGLIAIAQAQSKHRFITPPAGIGCAADIATARRVVLADTPLVGLRLAQAGVADVVIVEDPAVLPLMVDWLGKREIVIAGFRTASRAAIRSSLGPIGTRAIEVTVLPELERTAAATLALLGISKPTMPPLPLSLSLLRDLHRFAVLRLGRGDGAEALRSLGVDHAQFVQNYQVGYLPPRFRDVLSAEQKSMIKEVIPGNALVVPAFDEHRVIVDLMILPVATGRDPILTLHDMPRGLIAPAVTTAFDDVVVVDSLRAAADLTVHGRPQTVLLRGVADAQGNAVRMASSGVRRAEVRCLRQGKDIADILRAAGIEIAGTSNASPAPLPGKILTFPQSAKAALVVPSEPVAVTPQTPTAIPAPTAHIVLVEHDERAERATFSANDITYISEIPWDERTRVGVRIRRGMHEHVDRLDLAEDAQRKRCASSAALRTCVSASVIEAHLIQLHDAVCALAKKAASPLPRQAAPANAMSESERAAAMELAQRPDLLDRIVSDLTALYWIGEESQKRFGFLSALSRNLEDSVWLAFSGGISGDCSPGFEAIAAITPPEQCIRVSRLTDNAFYYANSNALQHKLLIIDDASAIPANVCTSLRILKRRGAISSTRVERDPIRGEIRTAFVEVRGPVGVLTTMGEIIDPQIQPYFHQIVADDSPEHVASVLADRRRRLAGTGSNIPERERAVARLVNLQRVIEPRPVVIPFAERIDGFGLSPPSRGDHDCLLSLIAAHALLYQHQRLSESGSIIATTEDFAVVAALMNERLAVSAAGIGKRAHHLLSTLWSARVVSFTMEDVSRLIPDWTRHAFRAALDELMELDYVSSPRSGRGVARTYHLHAGPVAQGTPATCPRIALRPVGELAEVGEAALANFISVTSTG
jgi:hypothetical protein